MVAGIGIKVLVFMVNSTAPGTGKMWRARPLNQWEVVFAEGLDTQDIMS
jgi:hypothetical protein